MLDACKIGDVVIRGAIINSYEYSEDGNELYLRLITIGANKENTKIESGSNYVKITTEVEVDSEFNEEIVLMFDRSRKVDRVRVTPQDGFMFITISYEKEKVYKIKVEGK